MTYPKTCPHCGQGFIAHRPSAIYCAPACRTGAYRERSGLDAGGNQRTLEETARRAELRAARLRGIVERKAQATSNTSTP